MKDRAWELLIRNAIKKRNEASELRAKAEVEYVRRFGWHPSDIDDDWWIDTMETVDNVDIQQVIENAKQTKVLHEAAEAGGK